MLNTRVRYSTYSPNFKSQKGSIEALNFCLITSQITSYLHNNPRKVKLLYIEDLIFLTFRGRKQIDERLLDETIDFVQKLMEEECDQYFERIETEAIKVW